MIQVKYRIDNTNILTHLVAYEGKISEAFKGMAGLGGCPGGGDLRMSDNLRKFANNFLKKIAKKALFWPIFERKFKTLALNVCAFGRNTIGWGNLEENFEWFDENLMENSIFIYFQGATVAKNRAFGNNIIFLQNFFRYGGFETP